MAADDPTPRELFIQQQAIVRDVAALVSRVDELARTLGATYIPRGEYGAHRESDGRRFEEIEKDLAAQAGFRRQVMASFAAGFLLLLVTIVFALAKAPGVS